MNTIVTGAAEFIGMHTAERPPALGHGMDRADSFDRFYGVTVKCACMAPLIHGVSAFLRCYLLKLGMPDGAGGFGIALVLALGSFLMYAKAREQASDCVDRTGPNH